MPKSDMPGEQTWPTQPFPTSPPPFVRQAVLHDRRHQPVRQRHAGGAQTAFKARWPTRTTSACSRRSARSGRVHVPGNNGGALFGTTSAEPDDRNRSTWSAQNNPSRAAALQAGRGSGGGPDCRPPCPGSGLHAECAACHGADRAGTHRRPRCGPCRPARRGRDRDDRGERPRPDAGVSPPRTGGDGSGHRVPARAGGRPAGGRGPPVGGTRRRCAASGAAGTGRRDRRRARQAVGRTRSRARPGGAFVTPPYPEGVPQFEQYSINGPTARSAT